MPNRFTICLGDSSTPRSGVLRQLWLFIALTLVLTQPVSAMAAGRFDELPAEIVAAMRTAGVNRSELGLSIREVTTGRVFASHNVDEAMNPASTMKLLTTYSALAQLGADFRWRTSAHLRGELRDGVLNGDLILKGGGDPKLVIEDLSAFIDQMRAAGLREIQGNLILDDSVFALDERSVEQFDGDPSQPYNVRPHGMLMNFKATKFIVTPRVDERGVGLLLDPPLADIDIDTDIRLTAGPCRYGVAGLVIRHTGSEHRPFVRVSGPYSTSCGEQSLFAAVLSHRQFAHAFFKAAWMNVGGVFKGQTRVERGAATGQPWLVWTSPRTLADAVSDINKFSNNVMARQVLLTTASQVDRRSPTVDDARMNLYRWLDRNGLRFPELVIENGSGLSRVERISARHLTELLRHAGMSPYADLMRQSLPRVGVDGTMRSRLVNDAVAGNAWMKTGTLNDVRALAGYVDSASGKRYAVSLLINGQRAIYTGGLQDAVLRWVYSKG